MLVLLLAQAWLREALCVHSDDEGVLQVARTDFHAYENAWSVSFGDLPGHAFDLLVFELCRSHCSLAPASTSRPQSCTSLAESFQEPGWHNEYMASSGNRSAGLCAEIHTAAHQVQVAASHVLSDEAGGALALLRAPLVLVLYNEDALVRLWTSQEEPDLLSVSVRVSYITSLSSHFVLRRSVLRVQVRRPVRDVLTFGVRNRCTGSGFVAPDLGSVTGVLANGRLRCVWHCRADLIRVPYNAAPPTPEQLNVSRPEYALLAVKYACIAAPSEWTTTVFGFSLETVSIPVESGVAQSLLDALDSVAETLRQRLFASGEGIVLLSVSNEFSHPVSFDEWTHNLRDAQCASKTVSCSKTSDTVNPRFLYTARRLLSETLDIVRVQGVLIAPLQEQSPAEQPLTTAERLLETVHALRSALQAVVDAGPVPEDGGGILIRGVQDIDFERVVLLAAPQAEDALPPTEEYGGQAADADKDLFSVQAQALVFFCVIFALAFIMGISSRIPSRTHACT